MINGFKTKIIRQVSFGQKIKIARTKKELSLEQAEADTQVRVRYLTAFEQDDFTCLPDQVYTLGYLQRYLEWLELPSDKFINEFKRARAAWQSITKQTLSPERIKDSKVIITPKLILSTLASLAVITISSYIWFQVRHLTAPPTLQINNPSAETKVALEKIEISGTTDPGAIVAINSQVINQDKNGHFKQTVALASGVNTIRVVATNRFQKQSSQTITILRTVPSITPGTNGGDPSADEAGKGSTNG